MCCGAKHTLSEGSEGCGGGIERSQEDWGVSPVQGGSDRVTCVECDNCAHRLCEETVPTVPPTLTAPPRRRVQITGLGGSVWADPGALALSHPSICSPKPPQPIPIIVSDRLQCCTMERATTLTPNPWLCVPRHHPCGAGVPRPAKAGGHPQGVHAGGAQAARRAALAGARAR